MIMIMIIIIIIIIIIITCDRKLTQVRLSHVFSLALANPGIF